MQLEIAVHVIALGFEAPDAAGTASDELFDLVRVRTTGETARRPLEGKRLNTIDYNTKTILGDSL
jgi:hypothetical protein